MSVANFEEPFIYKAFTKYYEEILLSEAKSPSESRTTS